MRQYGADAVAEVVGLVDDEDRASKADIQPLKESPPDGGAKKVEVVADYDVRLLACIKDHLIGAKIILYAELQDLAIV
jgi:hypothetical protein